MRVEETCDRPELSTAGAVLTAPADQRYMMTGFYQPARPRQKAIANVGVPPLMGSARDADSGIPLGKIVNFWLGNCGLCR